MLVPDPDINANQALTFNDFIGKYYEPTSEHGGLKDTFEAIDCTLSFITEMEHRALNRIGVEKGEDNLKHWDMSEFQHRSRLVQKGNVWPTVKDTGHDEVSGNTFIVDKSWPCNELASCRFPHDQTAKTCNAMCQIRFSKGENLFDGRATCMDQQCPNWKNPGGSMYNNSKDPNKGPYGATLICHLVNKDLGALYHATRKVPNGLRYRVGLAAKYFAQRGSIARAYMRMTLYCLVGADILAKKKEEKASEDMKN